MVQSQEGVNVSLSATGKLLNSNNQPFLLYMYVYNTKEHLREQGEATNFVQVPTVMVTVLAFIRVDFHKRLETPDSRESLLSCDLDNYSTR